MTNFKDQMQQPDSKKDLPIFIQWMDFMKWLLLTLDNFWSDPYFIGHG